MIDETSNGLRQCGPIGLRLRPGLDCRSRLVGQVQLRNQVLKFAIVGRNWPGICLEFSACHGFPPVFLNVSPLWSSNSLSETARTDLLGSAMQASASHAVEQTPLTRPLAGDAGDHGRSSVNQRF
jgi:hypothetical protein